MATSPHGSKARDSALTRKATPAPARSGTRAQELTPSGQRITGCFEDADALFRRIYDEYGPGLLRLATALTGGDRGRAEDLVQETMLRAWTNRNNVDLQHRSPRAWLATTARHLAVDAGRARRARPQEVKLDEDLGLASDQGADVGVDVVGVRAAIAALPRSQRQALAEVYYRDRSVAETANILHIPPGTVRSRTFYGLRALRRALATHNAVA